MSSKPVEEIMAQNLIHDSKITHSEVDLPSWNPEGTDNAKPQIFDRGDK